MRAKLCTPAHTGASHAHARPTRVRAKSHTMSKVCARACAVCSLRGMFLLASPCTHTHSNACTRIARAHTHAPAVCARAPIARVYLLVRVQLYTHDASVRACASTRAHTHNKHRPQTRTTQHNTTQHSTHTCVCARAHVCVHVCTCAHACAHKYTHAHTRACPHSQRHTCAVRVRACVRTCACACRSTHTMCVCARACACACVRVQTHIRTRTHTHARRARTSAVFTYLCACMCVCMHAQIRCAHTHT
jgi:hypothetical protein